jgi:hypothetical protein
VVVRGGRPHDVAVPTPRNEPRPRGGFAIEEEATTVTGNAPARSYLWAIVAVVAAIVGVAIGVIVGMR